MKSRRVWHLVTDAAQSGYIYGWLLGGLGIAIAILSVPEHTVSLRVFLWISVAALIVIAILVHIVWKLYNGQAALFPSLITVETAPVPGDPTATILVLEASDLFSHDNLVGIYGYARSFERLIGTGYVLTVQTRDNKIQVCVTEFVEPKVSDIWQGLMQQNANLMKEVIVKPYLPRNYSLKR